MCMSCKKTKLKTSSNNTTTRATYTARPTTNRTSSGSVKIRFGKK